MKTIPRIARMTPKRREKKKESVTRVSALSLSFAPREREARIPPPIPIVNPTACIIAIMEKTTPTAAEALVPIWETKYVSAIL